VAFGMAGVFVKGVIPRRARLGDLGMDKLEGGEVVIGSREDCPTLLGELSLQIRLEAREFTLSIDAGGKLLRLAFRGESGGDPSRVVRRGIGQGNGLAVEEFHLVQMFGVSTGIFLGSVELCLTLSIKVIGE